MLNFLGEMIRTWYSTFGYGGIILAMALESCLIPLPSEIILPLAGAMTLASFGAKFNLVGIMFAGGIGSVLGSSLAYWIGTTGGRPFIMKYGKYILISRHDFDIADRWFGKYGSPIAFFSRMLPVIRTYISLPAGITRMNYPRFVLYSFLGSLPWSLLLAYIGQKLGSGYDKVGKYLHGLDYVIIGVFVILAGLYVWRHIKHERDYDAHNALQSDTNPTKKMKSIR